MPTRHYVIAIRRTDSGKRFMLGPFEHSRQASAMTMPVRSAINDDPIYENANIRTESVTIGQKRLNAGETFPIGKFDLARIDLADVVEAAAKHKVIWYDRR